jgi:hypothetical protein
MKTRTPVTSIAKSGKQAIKSAASVSALPSKKGTGVSLSAIEAQAKNNKSEFYRLVSESGLQLGFSNDWVQRGMSDDVVIIYDAKRDRLCGVVIDLSPQSTDMVRMTLIEVLKSQPVLHQCIGIGGAAMSTGKKD